MVLEQELDTSFTRMMTCLSGTATRAIRKLSLLERSSTKPSLLKGNATMMPDAVGEQAIIGELEQEASRYGPVAFDFILDPSAGTAHRIGSGNMVRWVYADPLDGTIKVAGLGNEQGKPRVVNDGVWGSGVAATRITDKPLDALVLSDFVFGSIADGIPADSALYPTNAYVYDGMTQSSFGFDANGRTAIVPRLITSSQTNLGQGIVAYDSFQACDRNSAPEGSEGLAVDTFRVLFNRNEGGAFDIARSYGQFSSILRGMFGYEGVEPQMVAFVVLNENLPNVVPVYSLIRGAGGFATDFQGNDLGDRKLADPRPNVIYSANEAIRDALVAKLSKLE